MSSACLSSSHFASFIMFLISSRALHREWLRWAATNPATNYDKILEQQRAITKHVGAAIVVLDMSLLDTREGRDGLTNVLISDIVLQLLSYVVQAERESIRQRQAEGFAAAKAHGARVRRPKKRSTAYAMTKEYYLSGHLTRTRQRHD